METRYTVVYGQFRSRPGGAGVSFGLRLESEILAVDDEDAKKICSPLLSDGFFVIVRPDHGRHEFRAFHTGDWDMVNFVS